MKIGKKVILSLAFCAVSLCAVVFVAKADGILVPPPSRTIFETDQKAVIFHDEGIEHLIISITFQGDAGDFAWIVPTPVKPEVTKSTDALFTRLDELTRPEYPVPERENFLGIQGALDATKETGVTVLETKKIEYYDISVLEASDNQALYNWLNDHGYRFPQAGNYIIDEYIQKGWLFTAVKIDNDRESIAQGQMNAGHAVPLKLSFATDQIVYPLKISSLSGMEDDAPGGQITYVDGVSGKAAKLDSDRILATDRVLKNFSAENGKINFNIKKRTDDPVHKIVGIRSINSTGGEYDSVTVINNRNNMFQFTINKNYYEQYQVDLGSDFKQNEWQRFEFSWQLNSARNGFDATFLIDGIERTLNKIISSKNSVQEGSDLPRVILGGNYIEYYVGQEPDIAPGMTRSDRMPNPSIYIDRTSDLLIDNLEINSDRESIFRANFDDNLDISLSEGETDVLRVFNKSNMYSNLLPIQDSMGVLLYVFAEKKYDITGFDVQYAGWMEKEDIENIAKIDGKTPWITPVKDKYFLTRHFKYMSTSEMTDDIYPIESDNQSSYNFAGSENAKITWVFILIGLSVVSLGAMVWFVLKSERKKNLPAKPLPHEVKKSDG